MQEIESESAWHEEIASVQNSSVSWPLDARMRLRTCVYDRHHSQLVLSAYLLVIEGDGIQFPPHDRAKGLSPVSASFTCEGKHATIPFWG